MEEESSVLPPPSSDTCNETDDAGNLRLDLNETVTHLQIEPAASQRLPNNVSPSKPDDIKSSLTAVEMPPTTAIVDDEHSAMNLEVAPLNNRTIFSTNNLKRLQHVFQLRKLNEDNAANLRGLMAALFTDEDASALLDLFVDDGDQGSRVTVLAVFENLIKAGLKSITWEEMLMHFSSNEKTRCKAFDFVKRMFGTVKTSDSVVKTSISAMPSPTKKLPSYHPSYIFKQYTTSTNITSIIFQQRCLNSCAGKSTYV